MVRVFRSQWILSAALLLASCMPTQTTIVLKADTIPDNGIYSPSQVVIAPFDSESYELAAAGIPSYTTEQVKKVAYCGAQLYAADQRYSGWFVRDSVETLTPWMREVNVVVTFYRGEKPHLVSNKNRTDWCN